MCPGGKSDLLVQWGGSPPPQVALVSLSGPGQDLSPSDTEISDTAKQGWLNLPVQCTPSPQKHCHYPQTNPLH